jgi:hypothetical protein
MRTYGRTQDVLTGKKTWVTVTTDLNGFNDMVMLTTLAQCLKLNLGESPFWADWGIPAYTSIVTQIHPDLYMAMMQQRFAPYFMTLMLQKMDDILDQSGRPAPYYAITIITNYGATLERMVPI